MERYNDFTETENVILNPDNINKDSFDFAGRDVVAYFENKPKRYKIKQKKAFEQEIDEEAKRVTLNTIITGSTALATTICALSVANDELDFVQRCAFLLLTTVTSKGIYDSAKILSDSIKRKTKLENKYFDTYGIEYEEKRGRSL